MGLCGVFRNESTVREFRPFQTMGDGNLKKPGASITMVESIFAALNPKKTDFIFFVADGTGGHAFATNLSDHNQNVANWRAIEKNSKD